MGLSIGRCEALGLGLNRVGWRKLARSSPWRGSAMACLDLAHGCAGLVSRPGAVNLSLPIGHVQARRRLLDGGCRQFGLTSGIWCLPPDRGLVAQLVRAHA